MLRHSNTDAEWLDRPLNLLAQERASLLARLREASEGPAQGRHEQRRAVKGLICGSSSARSKGQELGGGRRGRFGPAFFRGPAPTLPRRFVSRMQAGFRRSYIQR